MALTSGTKLGPYEIISPLGAGGMGEVYRAKDTRLERQVAVKILLSNLTASPGLLARFEREAKIISGLQHPNICVLHDIGKHDGMDFLVMEYLEGETLADRLAKGTLKLNETLKIAIEIADALDKAHKQGIVHRDLKPGNVMLTKSGAKLMDFGLAKPIVIAGSAESDAPYFSAATISSPVSPITQAGSVLGTIQYMSPEQISGKAVDARSDIFAFGAMLYEMLTGKRAFIGKTQLKIASAIMEDQPESISSIQPLTPLALEHVVNTCLAKDPDDRYQTAHDVRLELKWISESSSLQKEQAVTSQAKTITRFLPWTIATVATVALIFSVIYFAKNNKPDIRYKRVSYREGVLQSARFSHDGQTIVFSGEWEGGPMQVSVARVGSPESRPLGITSASLAAISSTDELAVLTDCEPVFNLYCGGTLATVSLAGGSPRDLAGHIAYAAWAPDGKQLAVSIFTREGARLEYPLGHVIYQQKTGWFGNPKFSRDGRMIAFENHNFVEDDGGSIEIVDLSGKRLAVTQRFLSV